MAEAQRRSNDNTDVLNGEERLFHIRTDNLNFCMSNAMHGQNINLPVCVCQSHFLSTRLQVRPLNGFLQLTDADLRKDVPFGGLDDE